MVKKAAPATTPASTPARRTKAEVIKLGRKYLAEWLTLAAGYGTLFYRVEHVSRSGMQRRIVLATIVDYSKRGKKPTLSRLMPGSVCNYSLSNDELDIVAKDWGYAYNRRAFVVGGSGMDMVFALVDHLLCISGIKKFNANDIDREIF